MRELRVSEAQAVHTRSGCRGCALYHFGSRSPAPRLPCSGFHPEPRRLQLCRQHNTLPQHCVALTRPLLPSGSLRPPVTVDRPHPLFTSGAPLHMAKPVPTRGLGEKPIHHLASFSDSPRDSLLLGRQCLRHLLTPNPAGTESALLAALRLFPYHPSFGRRAGRAPFTLPAGMAF